MVANEASTIVLIGSVSTTCLGDRTGNNGGYLLATNCNISGLVLVATSILLFDVYIICYISVGT
jgi:hypothetical protein